MTTSTGIYTNSTTGITYIGIIFNYYSDSTCQTQDDLPYVLTFETGCTSSTGTNGYVFGLQANPPSAVYKSGYFVSTYYGSSLTCSGNTGSISQDATVLGLCEYAFGNAWFDQTITGVAGSNLAFTSTYYKQLTGGVSCQPARAVFFFTDTFSNQCQGSAVDSSVYQYTTTVPTFAVDKSRRTDTFVDSSQVACSTPLSIHWVSPSVCNYNPDDGTSYTVSCTSQSAFTYTYYSDYQCTKLVSSQVQGGSVCGVASASTTTSCVLLTAPTYFPTRTPTMLPTATVNTAFTVSQVFTGITIAQFNANLRLNSLVVQQAVAQGAGGGLVASNVVINSVVATTTGATASSLSADVVVEGSGVALQAAMQGVVVSYTITTNAASSLDTVNQLTSNLLTAVGNGLFQTFLWTSGVNNGVLVMGMAVAQKPVTSNPYTPPAAAASSNSASAGLSSGGVAGIVITLLLVIGGAGFAYYYYYFYNKSADSGSGVAKTSAFSWNPNVSNSGHSGQELMSKSTLKASLLEENSISAL